MTSRRINDGDIVWVNPDRPPRYGRPVLARVWGAEGYDAGGMTVKVWRSNLEGGLWGDGDDEDGHNPVLCERFEIIGPVVWIQPQGFPPD